uniref:OSCP1 n=1 Tax=Panagrolaimus superbus TaxID=310955 RepID=A0A914YAM1_9BILA
MSSLAMPLLIINLGGEMSYILEQRLQAQNVIEDKSVKVLHEIISAMLNKTFLKKLFYPQPITTRTSVRQLFEKIAHSSIMRLNDASMDKLFDLMTMAVKYQIVMVRHPYELFNVTLNHLDGIRSVMKGNDNMTECLDFAYQMLRQIYFTLPEWKMALIRHTMLSFFQDAKVKVSILMREDKQNREGDFNIVQNPVLLPPHANIPGSVRYYTNGEFLNSINFPLPSSFVSCPVTNEEYDKRLGMEVTDRGTVLGHNMYATLNEAVQVKDGTGGREDAAPAGPLGDELSLLTKLLTSNDDASSASQHVVLSLFDDDDDEPKKKGSKANGSSSTTVGKVKISKTSRPLDSAMKELSIRPTSKKGKGENLANLMEEASATKQKPRSASVKKRSDSAKGQRTPSRNGSAKKK